MRLSAACDWRGGGGSRWVARCALVVASFAAVSSFATARAQPGGDPTTLGAQQPPAAPPPDQAVLAAIQKAMNDLAPAAQTCWAAVAAAERFDIAGELTAQIDIPSGGASAGAMGAAAARTGAAGTAGATVKLVRDTAGDPALAVCVTRVLGAYRYAPPLAGQSIRLPFAFRAPDGQSVIDRRLVPFHAQGKLSLAVILDQANTGNAGAALFDVVLAPGGATGLRWADRDELWYIQSDGAVVAGATGIPTPAPAGSLVYVPAGGVRNVTAGAGELHVVLVVAPGGREGTARAGALPNREVMGWRRPPLGPAVVTAGKHGPFAVELQKIRELPAHVDPHGTELFYVLAGTGTLTVGGTSVAIGATSAIQIPPSVERSLHADGELTALAIRIKPNP